MALVEEMEKVGEQVLDCLFRRLWAETSILHNFQHLKAGADAVVIRAFV
jgi:hypothetical protein